MENEIRTQLMELLKDKMQRLEIRDRDMAANFDLVKSGFVNSLEFVDLVASLERYFDIEIDFEEGFDTGSLTTVGGLVSAIEKRK